MATSLNSVNFPLEPVKCERRKKSAGLRKVMADGSLDYRPQNTAGYRYFWNVQVDGLTAAQVPTIEDEFDAAILADTTWVPTQGGSYSVRALSESWSQVPDVQGGVLRFTVTFQLEEAA